MKKIIILTMLLIIATTTFSQQTKPSPTITKQDYLKKSRHQKTAAWIVLGGGLLSTGLGSIRFKPNDTWGGGNDQPTTGSTVFLVTGLAAIGASIPFFISASKNKKKAADVSFRMEKAPQIQQGSFVYRSYLALSFRLNL